MNECLITKLKANVQDNSLAKLGVLKITLKPNSTAESILCSELGNSVLSVVSGTLTAIYKNTGENVVFPYTLKNEDYQGVIKITTGNNGAVVELSNKYSLKNIKCLAQVSDTNFDDIIYCNKLKELAHINGDTAKIKNNFPEITAALFLNVTTMGLLSDFGMCTKLVYLETRGSNISGAIEDFVKEQRLNGRVTCESLYLGWENPNLTFNGTSIGSSPEGKYLSWTDSTITYDGETINV